MYNSAAYVRLGAGAPEILHVHRKNFLPTYGLFDEERFVERGHEMRAFDTPWGRAAILVCEDAWHSLSGTVAALDDAQLIFLSSAAPARGVWPRDDAIPGPASVARWERLVRDIAEEHGVFVTFANLVGSEGGKMFPGSSMVMGPRGDMRVRAPVWDEAIVTATIDFGDLARARADTPLLADLRTALPHLRELLEAVDGNGVRHPVEWDPAPERSATRAGSAAPAAAGNGSLARAPGGAAPSQGSDIVHRSRRRTGTRGAAAAGHRRTTRRALARRVHPRRDAASRIRARRRRAVGRRGLRRHDLPRRPRVRPVERRRRASAVPDVEPGEPRARAARHRRARCRSQHGRHQRGRRRLSRQRARCRSGTPRQRHGSAADDRALRPVVPLPRAAPRNRQQDRAPVRVFHLARGRLAADQPVRRPVQDVRSGRSLVTSAFPT